MVMVKHTRDSLSEDRTEPQYSDEEEVPCVARRRGSTTASSSAANHSGGKDRGNGSKQHDATKRVVEAEKSYPFKGGSLQEVFNLREASVSAQDTSSEEPHSLEYQSKAKKTRKPRASSSLRPQSSGLEARFAALEKLHLAKNRGTLGDQRYNLLPKRCNFFACGISTEAKLEETQSAQEAWRASRTAPLFSIRAGTTNFVFYASVTREEMHVYGRKLHL